MYIVPSDWQQAFDRLSQDKQRAVYARYSEEKKSAEVALICAIFGVSLIYMGRIGAWIAYLITAGGLGIWWIVEVVNAKKNASRHNSELVGRLISQNQ